MKMVKSNGQFGKIEFHIFFREHHLNKRITKTLEKIASLRIEFK